MGAVVSAAIELMIVLSLLEPAIVAFAEAGRGGRVIRGLESVP
jgi:hypothetical protein